MEDKIRRLIELDSYKLIRNTHKKEKEKLMDEVMVYYNSKTKKIVVSGGTQVILILKTQFSGWGLFIKFMKMQHKHNKPLLNDWLKGIRIIRSFERERKIKLFYDVDIKRVITK